VALLPLTPRWWTLSVSAADVEESQMLSLADQWVWDSWIADDGERYHLFLLQAPKSSGSPELRRTLVVRPPA